MNHSNNKKVSENTENREWDLLDGILPSLLKKGCLTDIECRIIASTKNLSERKSVIYDMIMCKKEEEASKLIAALRTSTQSIRDNETAVFQNQSCNQNECAPISKMATNPFLINTVIKNLFGYLRLKHIKKYRLVCRQWNSTAEIVLRKRCQIHFRPNLLQPSTFLQICKYSLPDLPYPSFKFSSKDLPWTIVEIQEFFDQYGKNIKTLILDGIILTERTMHSETFLPIYDVSTLFSNCVDITFLKMNSFKNSTTLRISLDKLASIKRIALRNCGVIIDPEFKNTCIAPSSIYLFGISVQRGETVLSDYHYNDFINFSQTENALLTSCKSPISYPKLDMQSQIFNGNRFHLCNVDIENWAEAKGEVQFLHVHGLDFIQRTQLKIKELVVKGKHVIDLSALPQTIQKLKLLEKNQIICSSVPIELPNLKYLLFDIVDNNSHLLTHFTNCSNLTEIELGGSEEVENLNLSCIPKSVQKIKLNCVHINFLDYTVLQVDKLILDDKKHLSQYIDFANVIDKIQARVLVLVVTEKTQLPAADILRLVEAYNNQSPKFFIGAPKNVNLPKSTKNIGSFAECVNGRPYYYQFKNKIARPTPKRRFDLLKTLNGI